MTFTTFTLAAGGAKVLVNLANITFVRPIGESGCMVTFDNENTLHLEESVQDIALEIAAL